MDIAVTADVHLTGDDSRPERYSALRSIFEHLDRRGTDALVIAGDLFDRESSSYSRFEELCADYPGIDVHVLPGNHDHDISGRMIVGGNITVHEDMDIVPADDVSLVFVPYSQTATMAEHLQELEAGDRWVLIGHGEYLGGGRVRNPYEPGTYMPLYRRDIEMYRPWKVFLGHIHRPMRVDDVFYPGSPCGMDINETGRRRFLLLDTSTGHVTSKTVRTDVIFFQETFLVIPDENETERLAEQARRRMAAWGLEAGERDRAVVRVRAVGYSTDRQAAMDCLTDSFEGLRFFRDEGPDVSGLKVARDIRRNVLARRTVELIDELEWEFGGDEPEREQVIQAALSIIFGEG